jgi:O-glycosyl hydrolase
MLANKKIRKHLDSIDTHSYFTYLPFPLIKKSVNDRVAFMKRYKKFMDRHYPNVPIKTSEWTHMKGGRDYGMDSALVQAKTMFEDLTILDVTSWQHWIALSHYDFCDGLIYYSFEENSDERIFELTKRYYAFGNFSKFVEKGSKRIDVKCEDKDLNVIAFKNKKTVVVIVINDTDEEKEISFENVSDKAKMYVTNDTDSLKEYDILADNIKISKKSVNTISF